MWCGGRKSTKSTTSSSRHSAGGDTGERGKKWAMSGQRNSRQVKRSSEELRTWVGDSQRRLHGKELHTVTWGWPQCSERAMEAWSGRQPGVSFSRSPWLPGGAMAAGLPSVHKAGEEEQASSWLKAKGLPHGAGLGEAGWAAAEAVEWSPGQVHGDRVERERSVMTARLSGREIGPQETLASHLSIICQQHAHCGSRAPQHL